MTTYELFYDGGSSGGSISLSDALARARMLLGSQSVECVTIKPYQGLADGYGPTVAQVLRLADGQPFVVGKTPQVNT